nr:uncharacterized protein LOC129282580 [Lytechinus pictus]
MEKLLHFVISFTLVLCVCLLCLVGAEKGPNYGGKLFAFSFLADRKSRQKENKPCVIDIISGDLKNSSIHVAIPRTNFERTFILQPGHVERVNLSLGTHQLPDYKNATVIVNSTRRIGVVAYLEFLRPVAAFHVIPSESTGTRHIIAHNKNKLTLFTITSLADNNFIHIYNPWGNQFNCDPLESTSTDNATVVLWRFESMFCKGKKVDLTGTFVKSEKNVSVVAGGMTSFFEKGTGGYILEQMVPQRFWGNHFAVAPFARIDRFNYLLKIFAPEGTVANVTVSGLDWENWFTVHGQHFSFDDQRAFDQVIEITANESISIVKYMIGSNESNANGIRSDPSMFNVPPLNESKRNLLVDVLPFENENIMDVIINCRDIQGFLVNGSELKVSRVISMVNGTTYCALSYELEPGLHCVSHKNPEASFQVALYSWKMGRNGSNAYAMEAALDVPAKYPTCLPVEENSPEYQFQERLAGLQDENYCGNNTTLNRPANIAMEIEHLAVELAAKMIAQGTPGVHIDLGVAVIEIKRINSSGVDPSTVISIPSNANSTQPKTRGLISMEILQELETQAIISIVFRNLGERIDNCSTSNDSEALDPSGDREMVGSQVLSLSLYPSVASELKLPSPVGMVFPMQKLPPRFADGLALCSFWNYTLRGWSQEGCWPEFVNSSVVECACDHLTNFAVLMQINEYHQLSPADTLAANVITSIGCGLSIAGAFFTIFSFIILSLKSDRVMIHINLALAVGLGQIMILFLDTPTKYQVQCTVKASLLYYFFMSAFCWMLIEGVNLFLQAVVVFSKPGSRIKIYLVIGWLCPIIPLSATLAFYKGKLGDDVTTHDNPVCFLKREDDSIWFFVVPILTIIALNVYFVSRVVFEIIKLAGGPTVVNNRITRAKHGVKACVILLPVMGLTWIFGIMWQDQSTLVFMYLFLICNSLQGFFIFVFHCLLNSEVRNTFKRRKVEWRNSFSRRSSFNLKAFRSDDSKRKQNTVDTNRLSAIATPTGSHNNENNN